MTTTRPIPPLYHWSPSERRQQIQRYGLRPAMRSTTCSEDFRAPYVCLADDPSWGWALSGSIVGKPGQAWDLWLVFLADSHKIRRVRHWNGGDPNNGRASTWPRYHEWRVYDRIYKRGVVYVATRMLPCGRSGP